MGPVDVAAENRDAADPEAEREERLPHRRDDHVEQPYILNRFQARLKIEAQPLPRSRQQAGTDAEPEKQQQQTAHQNLGDPLHTAPQPERAHQRRTHHRNQHIADHLLRRSEEVVEERPDLFGRETGDAAGEIFAGVGNHPAGHRGVEDHQNDVPGEEKHSETAPVPFPGRGQHRIGSDDVPAAGAPQRQLHHHDRIPQRDEEEEVDQHEDRAAVLPADEGEAPDVPEPDGAPGGEKNEPEPGTEIFTHGIVHVEAPFSSTCVTSCSSAGLRIHGRRFRNGSSFSCSGPLVAATPFSGYASPPE